MYAFEQLKEIYLCYAILCYDN